MVMGYGDGYCTPIICVAWMIDNRFSRLRAWRGMLIELAGSLWAYGGSHCRNWGMGEIGKRFQLYLDVSVYSSNWLVVDIPVCWDMSRTDVHISLRLFLPGRTKSRCLVNMVMPTLLPVYLNVRHT